MNGTKPLNATGDANTEADGPTTTDVETGRARNLTPSWTGLLPVMLVVLEDGDREGKRLVGAEFRRMAMLADLGNEALAALLRLQQRGYLHGDGKATQVVQAAMELASESAESQAQIASNLQEQDRAFRLGDRH